MRLAVPPDAQFQPVRQGVDDRNPDAVQAARHLVAVLIELSARMQLGHDDLGGGHALFLVHVDGDAAAVVAHRDAVVGVDPDLNEVRMPRQRLVDAVVDGLVDHVVQAGPVIGVADIHPRSLANRVQALENLDRIGIVLRLWGDGLDHAAVPRR